MANESEGHRAGAGFSVVTRVAIVIVLIVVVGTVIHLKVRPGVSAPKAPARPSSRQAQPKTALPRLLDLGADRCIPCRMMAPMLKKLRKEYQGKFEVVFIDVWKNPKAGRPYGIRLIPTQIFLDASGKELYRHEGFFSENSILATWKALGLDLEKEPAGVK